MTRWTPVSLTQALVRTPGLSGEEQNVAALVETVMADLDFRDIRRDELGNVIGLVGPPGNRAALLFDAHMDVVPATGDWTVDPFGGEIKDNRIWGRGATDMKGGLAAALCGVAAAARKGELRREVAVSASVLEETIEGGAIAAVLDNVEPEMVVICEPSSLNVQIGQRGRAEILLEIKGVPAHAAHPERGLNPILLSAQAIAAIESMELPEDDKLGRAIMVPTDIISDPHPSISLIPSTVTVRFDRRTVTGDTREGVLSALESELAKVHPDAFKVSVASGPVATYTGKAVEEDRYLSAWRCAKEMPLAKAAAESLREIGVEVRFGAYSFCTNGSESAGRRNLPTIGLGPGAEADAHIVDESVSIDEVEKAAVAYRELTLKLAGGNL